MAKPFESARELHLNHVTVPVADIARAVAFYRGLGLVPVVETEHYARLVAPGNGATFSVERGTPPTGASALVYFECDGLDAVVAALEAAGVAIDEPPTDRRWRWREARLRDPDGNALCLYHAGDDRLNPPWRVPESAERHVLSRERFRGWLDRYAAAWTARDPEAAGALFAEDARYWETPFDPPAAGREAIVRYWHEQTATQRDVRFRAEIVHALDRTGVARWTAAFTREGTGRRELDGVLEATFDARGLATAFREWWHGRNAGP